MPIRFGVPELLIILAVVVLLFGVGRIGRVAGEMGKGIRAFREALKDEEKDDSAPDAGGRNLGLERLEFLLGPQRFWRLRKLFDYILKHQTRI